MNLAPNIFHLPIIPDKKQEAIDFKRKMKEDRERLASAIWELKRDPDFGLGGHTAGWNAALDAALKVVAGGRNSSS